MSEREIEINDNTISITTPLQRKITIDYLGSNNWTRMCVEDISYAGDAIYAAMTPSDLEALILALMYAYRKTQEKS